jgi:hypothetical protein
MNEETSGSCLLSTLEGGWAECAAGDGLQEPFELDALCSNQRRSGGEVENSGEQACERHDFEGSHQASHGLALE